MKKLVLYFLAISISTCSFAQINENIDNGSIGMWEGGGGDAFYTVTEFNMHNFGTLDSESNLYLKSGQINIWKNASGDITEVSMLYRIYEVGETPNDFINANLPWHSEYFYQGTTFQLWWNDAPDEIDLNLLDGISDGDYVIEVYFQAVNGSSETLYLNNATQNYKAYFTYDTSTDIANETDNSITQFELYPNPASNNLSIRLNKNIDVKSIEILNCESKVIYEDNVSTLNFNTPVDLPIYNLDSGIYFIKIETSKGIEVKRFIISK